MQSIKPGDLVRIIDIKNSGPVPEMRKMIGRQYVVQDYFDEYNDRFRVGGYIYHRKDLEKINKFVMPKGGLFNIENLFCKD